MEKAYSVVPWINLLMISVAVVVVIWSPLAAAAGRALLKAGTCTHVHGSYMNYTLN